MEHCSRSFSTVLGQFKGVQEDLLIVKIRNLGVRALRTCKVARVYAEIEKSYLVETQFWAQNDRNGRVYISTYNNPKL